MARILVVDDDPHIREILKEMLLINDHAVDLAENGSQAIEKVKKKKYDLLIIDRNMPGITGVDAIAIIRSSPKFAGLKILMLTSATLTEDVDEAYRAGANDYAIKPLEMKQLMEKVNNALK